MHECMRYKNPDIRQHLASHYVLGSQSALVRRRIERLMKTDSQLEAEVYQWQNNMMRMNDAIDAQTPPASVWKNITASIDGDVSSTAETLSQRIFKLFTVWQAASFVLAALLIAQLFIIQPTPTLMPVGADYVALMDSNDADSNPELLISAYLSKGNNQPSRLEFEWNDRTPRSNISGLTLFAIDKDSGAVTNLGLIADDSASMLMSKVQWKALKNSSELVITQGADINQDQIFRGPCIQIARAS